MKKDARAKSRRSIVPVVVGGLVVLAAIAAAVTWFWGARTATGSVETRDVRVTGTPLPVLPDGATPATDPARGRPLPEIRGASFDGKPVAITNDGRPKVVVLLAHWCPHCQREVPPLVASSKDLPAGVTIVSVSTAVSQERPNYPPSAWLAREHWPFPVLADDAQGKAAEAVGLSGFPFFVFVRADGTVAARREGELPLDALKQIAASLTRS